LKPVPRLAKNTAALAGAALLNQFTGFIIVLLISRYLGVSGLGQYSFLLAFLTMAISLSSLGLNHLLVREIAASKGKAGLYFVNGAIMQGAMGVLTILLAAVFGGRLVDMPHSTLAVVLISLTVLPMAVRTSAQSVFVAMESSEYATFVALVDNGTKLILVFILLRSGYGILYVALAVFVSRIVAASLGVVWARPFIKGQPLHYDPSVIRYLLRFVPTFALLAFFSVAVSRIDTLFLTRIKGTTDAGIYGASFNIFQMMVLLQASFAGAILPLLTKSFSLSAERFRFVAEKSLKLLFVLGLPVVVGISLLAEPIIVLVYRDPSFMPAAATLRVLIWSFLPLLGHSIFWRMLLSANRQDLVLRTTAINAGCLIALNLLLIPSFSYLGVAYAKLGTYCIAFAQNYYYVSKYLPKVSLKECLLKPVAAVMIMGIVVMLIRGMGLWVAVACGALAYLTALWLLRAFTAQDLELGKQLLPNFLRPKEEQIVE